MIRPKVTGRRGDYFATVTQYAPLEGERLPCVHAYHRRALDYYDPAMGRDTLNKRNADFFEVLEKVRHVVVTNDVATPDPTALGGRHFQRRGYVAIYPVESIEVGPTWFRLRLSPHRVEVA